MLRAICGLVLAVYAGFALAQAVRVPESFWGTWDSRAETCGKGGDGRLTITATQIEFYASRGMVLALHVNGPRDIEVEFEARGEGVTRRDTRRFVLSDDGKTLTNVMGSYSAVRVRCK
jgi:hypothetical protein